MISFTIPGKPQPQLRPRFTGRGGYVRTYDPAKCKAAKKIIADVAAMTAHDNGFHTPVDGPVSVSLSFDMPIPKSSRAKDYDYHLKRPDIDNLTKLVLDGITDSRAVWIDDSQIVEMHIFKCYSVKPETRVFIEQTAKPTFIERLIAFIGRRVK